MVLSLPEEIRRGQRLTAMSGNQASLPLAGSPFKFKPHGESGNVISDLLPHTATIADELCVIRSLYTEAINHGPAVTYLQTGSQFPGRPSMGAWLDYGLGTETDNLPAFVVLVTKGKGGQPLVSRLWGSGFLPSKYQGVRFRSGKEPVLYLNNPQGVDAKSRRLMLDRLHELHRLQLAKKCRSSPGSPYCAIRDGLPNAILHSGRRRLLQGTGECPGSLREGRTESRQLRGQLFTRPAPGRAGCALCTTLSPGVGPARQPSWCDWNSMPGNRPGIGCPHQGPQTAKLTG